MLNKVEQKRNPTPIKLGIFGAKSPRLSGIPTWRDRYISGKKKISLLLMAALLLSFGIAYGQGGYWPTFHHDLSHTGRCSAIGPETNSVLWSFSTGGRVMYQPTIGNDGTIYFGRAYASGQFYALYPDGSVKWVYPNSGYTMGSSLSHDGSTIYFGTCENDIVLCAVNTADGTLEWEYATNGCILDATTVGPDGTIYFATCDGGFFYAVNPDGTLKWWRFIEPGWGGGVQGCAAIGSDSTIYFGSYGGNVYALDPDDGSLKWSYSFGTNNLVGALSIGSDSTIYVPHRSASVAALNPDGTLKWDIALPNAYYECPSCPAIGSDGTIYVEGGSSASDVGHLYALDPDDGSVIWMFPLSYRPVEYPSPCIDGEGTIYALDAHAWLFAVHPDGILKWQRQIGSRSWASGPSIGPDGTIYCGHFGGVVAIGPGQTGVEESYTSMDYHLFQNTPNPFSGITSIQYSVAKPSNVIIKVYDIKGRLVNTLIDNRKIPGTYSVDWNGQDKDGRELASGVYFYRLSASGRETDTYTEMKKLIILR